MPRASDRARGKDRSWDDFDDFWEVWEIVIADENGELQDLIDRAERRVALDGGCDQGERVLIDRGVS